VIEVLKNRKEVGKCWGLNVLNMIVSWCQHGVIPPSPPTDGKGGGGCVKICDDGMLGGFVPYEMLNMISA